MVIHITTVTTALFSLSLLVGCDESVCGPDENASDTLNASLMQQTLIYDDWRSSPNNDCGEAGGPISLTLEATQRGTNRGFTLCLPRPDTLSGKMFDITDTTRVQVIDVFADLEPNCLVSLDRTKTKRGTIEFYGVCDDGTFADGFSLDLQIELPINITCDNNNSEATMTFAGKVAVSATTL